MVSWNLVNIDSDNGLVPDSTKPLSEPMVIYCQLDTKERHFNENLYISFQENTFENGGSHFVSASMC